MLEYGDSRRVATHPFFVHRETQRLMEETHTIAPPLPRRAYVIFGVTALTLLMSAINGFIVSVAFPTIQSEFASNLALVGWVFTGFMLANVIVLPLAGKLSDDFGRKRVYIASVVLFAGATLGCGLAPNIYILVLCRIVQGIGGGAIGPSATGIISDAFGERRRTALGLFSSIYPIGAILGPTIGGLVIEHLSWRWIFFVNVPIAAVVVALAFVLFPSGGARQKSEQIDMLGALSYAAALLLFLFAATNLANHGDAYKTPLFWGYVVGAGGAMALFLWQERRVVAPMIDLRLLTNRPFMALNMFSFVYGIAIFAVITFLPLNAQLTYAMSPMESGFVLTPRALIMIAASTGSAFLLSRTGYRVPMITGVVVGSVATLLLGLGIQHPVLFGIKVSDLIFVSAIMGLSGFGNGMVLPSMGNAGLDLVPGKVAAITGLMGVFSSTGGIVGTALIILVMSHFPDQGAGLRVMLVVMSAVVLLSIPFTFFFPDLGRKRLQVATPSAASGIRSHGG